MSVQHESRLQPQFEMQPPINCHSTEPQQHHANFTAHHSFSLPNFQVSPGTDLADGWLQQRGIVLGNIVDLLRSDVAMADVLLLQDWAHPIHDCPPPINSASALGQITATEWTSK